jgi:hypothetical protein
MRAFVVALALGLAACSEAPQSPPVTATRVLELSGLQPLANALGLSPDGSLVVTGDFEADLIAREVPSGTERWKVRVKPRREQRRLDGIFFSPDGSLIVTTGHEAQTTEVWDAATGRSVAVLDIGHCRGVAFHPDEHELLRDQHHEHHHAVFEGIVSFDGVDAPVGSVNEPNEHQADASGKLTNVHRHITGEDKCDWSREKPNEN